MQDLFQKLENFVSKYNKYLIFLSYNILVLIQNNLMENIRHIRKNVQKKKK